MSVLVNTKTTDSRSVEQVDASLMLAARICLLTIVLFSVSISTYLFNSKSELIRYTFIPIAVCFAISAASALWIKWRKTNAQFTFFQLIFDVLIVTGVIYISGGVASPFIFLYLPLVMAVSILVSRQTALLITLFSVLTYSSLVLCIQYGALPSADGNPIPPSPSGGIFLQILSLGSGMVLVAVLTSYLLRAMHSGYRIAEKSQRDIAELSSSQKELSDQLQMQEKMARLLAQKEEPFDPSAKNLSDFVGESGVMQKVFALIQKVAKSDATILISGESGTGKELVARAIHSGRYSSGAPFVAVNCGAIPENLIESQLFGHKKGAFTGAESDHQGMFLQADNGTLFLDEIGELPLLMQTKLLRAIQEKHVRPVGGSKDIPADVRIIAATNRNLKKEVESGRFREDLFYRLNVISVNLPPLRSRKEDIPLLVQAFLRKLIKTDKQAVVPPATMQLLMNYSYPGNVRELENILERAVVLGGEVILPEHLPGALREQVSAAAVNTRLQNGETTNIIIDESISLPVNLDMILANIEKKYLEVALLKTDGAKKKAADMLGINFRSFRYRLQKFGLSDE